jgi:hypothetical protein
MWTWSDAIENRIKDIRNGHQDPFRVARTEITDKCSVSTVVLGLDHNWGRGEPMLFETMIFGSALDQDQWRYATWDQAARGHDAAVAEARKALAQVDAIAKDAGASR